VIIAGGTALETQTSGAVASIDSATETCSARLVVIFRLHAIKPASHSHSGMLNWPKRCIPFQVFLSGNPIPEGHLVRGRPQN